MLIRENNKNKLNKIIRISHRRSRFKNKRSLSWVNRKTWNPSHLLSINLQINFQLNLASLWTAMYRRTQKIFWNNIGTRIYLPNLMEKRINQNQKMYLNHHLKVYSTSKTNRSLISKNKTKRKSNNKKMRKVSNSRMPKI